MPRRSALALLLCLACGIAPCGAQTKKPSAKQPPARTASPEEELQKAIADAGNDRSALVRNLRSYLERYPEVAERPRIYRALVEACTQLHDEACAADYAERIVALTPDDVSMTLLAVQLIELHGDAAALGRAVTYVTRMHDAVKDTPVSEKSPRVSLEEWEAQKKRDQSALLGLRGRLEERLQDHAAARRDFQSSYAMEPNSTAALRLGELDELAKDYAGAATEYARAFALADRSAKSANRRDIRQKLGNAWRLAHASDAGLGDFLLRTIDEVAASAQVPRPPRNAGRKDPFAFVLRRAPEGADYPLAPLKGKVLVLNFWATWCGPCHALEPIYGRMAARYEGNPKVLFLSLNCDEDESLVGPYLEARRSRAVEAYADGLEELFAVGSFPTLLILDAAGTSVFRANGFDPVTIERDLGAAIQRAASPPESEKTAAAHGAPAGR